MSVGMTVVCKYAQLVITTAHNDLTFLEILKCVSLDHISKSTSGVWDGFLLHLLKSRVSKKPAAGIINYNMKV